ncbi:MAG: hypothetical protein M0021_03635 [Clostridia bacterium]|nr:hypothetical protein [Clostridia bacterium]
MDKRSVPAKPLLLVLVAAALAIMATLGRFWVLGDSRGVFMYLGMLFMVSGLALYTWKITVFPNEEVNSHE